MQNPSNSFKKLANTGKRFGSKYARKALFREQERIGYGDEMHTEITEGKRNVR